MGWYSLFDKNDAWHKRAKELMLVFSNQRRPLCTSDYIIDETATLLLVRGASHLLPSFFERVNHSKALKTVAVSQSLFAETVDYFLKHRDQGYSFTDVTSFLLMRNLKIKEAFTHDHHFTKAGLQTLLA